MILYYCILLGLVFWKIIDTSIVQTAQCSNIQINSIDYVVTYRSKFVVYLEYDDNMYRTDA